MRITLDGITAPLTGWIPDISGVPPRRQATIGVIASVVLHLAGFLIMALFAGVLPGMVRPGEVRPQPEQLELQIMPPEEPKIMEAPVAEEKPFIDGRGLAEAKPAEKPVFESDKDMTAASEKPATGELPLPSQEGRGKIDNVFETRKAQLGSAKELPPVLEIVPAPVPSAPLARETASHEKPAPTAPAATPRPKTADQPDPAAFAKATLEKLREVETKSDREIALAAKELPPMPTPAAKTEPPVRPAIPQQPPAPQFAKLTTPAPKVPAKSGYQPEQEKSRVEGRITNRGKNAVSAVATPLGKYKAQVYNAIGSRWLFYVKSQMDVLAIGTARVSFFVTRAGRVQDIRVEENTANPSFAEVCERAIRDAEISQPPAGSLDQMRDSRLEYTITFTLYNFNE